MPGQSLSLHQSQQLQMVLAPQLRQSLEMLQVPLLELRAMVQQEMERNPTLEEASVEAPSVEVEPGVVTATDTDSAELDFNKEFEALAKLDEEWRDYFFQNLQSRPHSAEDDEKRQYFMDSLPQRESLQEHLLLQLQLADLSAEDMQLGELIIGSINDDGYLTVTIEELAGSLAQAPAHLEEVLAIVQEFHPTGVGARDLRECLLAQLKRLQKDRGLIAEVVHTHLDRLGERKYNEIARALKVSVEEVHQAARFIATLDPKPGRLYSDEVASYVLPEIVVKNIDGEWVVILNDDQLPHVRISNHYHQMLGDPEVKADVKSYIRERIRAGAFLIKSIEQRQHTIRRIATEIVQRQTEFLVHGISRLKPLTMAEVADVVGVHETTVSRAVSGKYMQTPVGVYELKYFFTPGIKTADGQEMSNMAVKEMIADMVAREDSDHPLSDQDIMARLQENGVAIARRTIAKYRLVLRIPPSHERRKAL